MADIGTLPGERLAGLSADLFHKVQKGAITLDELAAFLQRKTPASPALALVGEYSIGPLREVFDLQEFFENRKYVEMGLELGSILFQGSHQSNPTSATRIKVFDVCRKVSVWPDVEVELPQKRSDRQIEPWEFAKLLEGQQEGEKGPLQTDGHVNYFSLLDYYVGTRWRSNTRCWAIWAISLYHGAPKKGDRFFSRN